MKQYIAYLDVLGAKNSSEKEDFESYIKIITNFQNELIRISEYIHEYNGRIHFFSDSAFIECTDLRPLLAALQELRQNLINCNIFIRGAIATGSLGAINGIKAYDYIQRVYENKDIGDHFNAIKVNLERYKDVIQGTLFYSKDIAKLVHYESQLKGAAFFCDESIKNKFSEEFFTTSCHLINIKKHEAIPFTDLKYDAELITEAFITKIIRIYYTSNTYDINYGRYYLPIIISCINCTNFKNIVFDNEKREFSNTPAIFIKILNLRREFKSLYETGYGLEFVFLALINKVYLDQDNINVMTKEFLSRILLNKKYLNPYLSKVASIPKELLSMKAKKLMMADLSELAEDVYN